MAALGLWMNGHRVGEWRILRGGASALSYDPDWLASPYARPLSLSLPLIQDQEIRGPLVEHYFENLLPDSIDIRRRLRARFSATSMSSFDLLAAIGRDCVGAIQLLPPDETPQDWNKVRAEPLSAAQVERLLTHV